MSTTDAAAPPLVVTALEKRYRTAGGEVPALRGVELTVERGEFVAIMGASGSGKSTLLHAACGLTGVDAGSVAVAGETLAGMDDAALTRFRRHHLGIVFQAFNLIPVLSARDNAALPLTLDGTPAAEAAVKADAALAAVGLAERAEHRPDQLSGGEQQRVAIARALVAEPALIVADEPTGNLDSATTDRICKLLRELCDQGRTVVVVTHEPAVARWADRVVVLADGRVVDAFAVAEAGDAVELAARYQRTVATGGAA